MTLIAILTCLALQRFINLGGWFQPTWFELYLKKLSQWTIKLNEWLAILLIAAPVILVLALLHFIFAQFLSGLLNLFLAITVLFFCIDARDIKNKLSIYFDSLEKDDIQTATNSVASFVGDTYSGSGNSVAELNRAVTKTILLNSFEQLFAGLFWFIIFGIYGVSSYFLIALLRKNASRVDSNYIELAKLAVKLQSIFDWIPSRLVGVSYSLVGNFNKGFNYCRKNLLHGLGEIKDFAVGVGIAALDVDPDQTKATPKENYAALDLINRVLIIWLAALFFVLIGILIKF